jgi:hypothetical protein
VYPEGCTPTFLLNKVIHLLYPTTTCSTLSLFSGPGLTAPCSSAQQGRSNRLCQWSSSFRGESFIWSSRLFTPSRRHQGPFRTVGTSLYIIPNNKCGVRTNQNKGQTHVITIARTRYYYSQDKFVCHLEQKNVRTIVRTKSYCSRSNFVCHLEQKQMYCQNKLLS